MGNSLYVDKFVHPRIYCHFVSKENTKKQFMTIQIFGTEYYIQVFDLDGSSNFRTIIWKKVDTTTDILIDYLKIHFHEELTYEKRQNKEPTTHVIVSSTMGGSPQTYLVNDEKSLFDTIDQLLKFMVRITNIYEQTY